MEPTVKVNAEKSNGKFFMNNSLEDPPNLIKWDLHLKVKLLNVQNSKYLKWIKRLLLFLGALALACFLSQLREEIRTLQVQMKCANANLVILMLKYERLNQNFKRDFIDTSYDHSQRRFRRSLVDEKRFIGLESPENSNSPAVRHPSPEIEQKEPRPLDSADLIKNAVIKRRTRQNSEVPATLMRDDDKSDRWAARKGRALLLNLSKRNDSIVAVVDRGTEGSNDYEDEMQVSEGAYRTPRSRRDDGRGKHQRPLVSTFVGAIPEQHVTNIGSVGPWVKGGKNETRFSFNKFHLVEDKKSIEVTMNGLYMINTQMFYFGDSTQHSYWILLNSEGASMTQKLVKCATVSSTSSAEVSCHTSIIVPLRRGDRLRIQQEERNRLINLREGHSFIQIILLASDVHRKRVLQ